MHVSIGVTAGAAASSDFARLIAHAHNTTAVCFLIVQWVINATGSLQNFIVQGREFAIRGAAETGVSVPYTKWRSYTLYRVPKLSAPK